MIVRATCFIAKQQGSLSRRRFIRRERRGVLIWRKSFLAFAKAAKIKNAPMIALCDRLDFVQFISSRFHKIRSFF